MEAHHSEIPSDHDPRRRYGWRPLYSVLCATLHYYYHTNSAGKWTRLLVTIPRIPHTTSDGDDYTFGCLQDEENRRAVLTGKGKVGGANRVVGVLVLMQVLSASNRLVPV